MDAYTVHTINQALVLIALAIVTLVIIATPIYMVIADRRDNRRRTAENARRDRRADRQR